MCIRDSPGMGMLLHHKGAHAHTVYAMRAEACTLAYLALCTPVRFTPDLGEARSTLSEYYTRLDMAP
eukprot:12360285-Alexandrium_andersonii.AAC.1